MIKGPFLSKDWISANIDYNSSNWILVGVPYDGTCCYRPGSRFAPMAIRLASWGLEEYSPVQNKELDEVSFFDAGDLDLPFGNRDKSLEIIKENTRQILNDNKFYFGIGGEHLVTLPAFEAYLEKYPDIAVVHFDAHADLRETFFGEKLSHATVMRRIVEKIGPERFVQIGIRSGEKEEFDWIKENKTLLNRVDLLSHEQEINNKLKNRPIFMTIDLDVLDPSIMSGTGTPEPGGMMFNEFMKWLLLFKDQNIVGCDVVELAPDYDTTGVSTAVACKVIRELLMMIG